MVAKGGMKNNGQQENGAGSSGILSKSRRGFVGWALGALVLVLLVGLFVFPFFFQWPSPGYYGYYPHPWFFFFPFGFAFFFLIFFGVRWLFWGWGYGRGYWHGYGSRYWRNQGPWDNAATEILKQRYAKGEITKEQFDQMMRDLKAHEDA